MGTKQPKAVAAYERIQDVLRILRLHPDGLPLAALAAELDVDEATLRQDVLTYFAADISQDALLGLQRPSSIAFLADNRNEETDPVEAPVLRLESWQPQNELGVEHLTAGQLSNLHDAARSLLALEPDNIGLANAVAKLEEQLVEPGRIEGSGFTQARVAGEDIVSTLVDAATSRRVVELEYSRAWNPGTYIRKVHPYRVEATRRGYELDAGPVQSGHARTYLLQRVRSVKVTDQSFTVPADIDDVLSADRTPVSVDLVIPHGKHWVIDRVAESSQRLEADGSHALMRAELLPPLADRVAFVLITCGSDAMVADAPNPSALHDAAVARAKALADHHSLDA